MPTRDRPVSSSNSAGYLLWLVRSGRARTRGELQRYTGLARSTVGQRLDALLGAGYLRVSGMNESTGGRPPSVLEFNDRHGVVLVGYLGATHGTAAVLDLAGRTLAARSSPVRVSDGPEPVLTLLEDQFGELLTEAGTPGADVRGIGLGVPGPVEFDSGVVRQPPIMPGWDGFPIGQRLERRWSVPILVDNDANLMALGEQLHDHPQSPSLVLVKVSTGIGAGIVVDGSVYRGIDGGAGDLGHIRLHDRQESCMCGAQGCLAAVSSGAALARQLTELGTPAGSSNEFARHVANGHPEAVRLARDAGRTLGDVLTTVVCLVNPEVLVLAGDLAETQFVTGVREVLYQRALPRATRNLRVLASDSGDEAGIRGAHAMVVDNVYAPESVNERLRGGDPS